MTALELMRASRDWLIARLGAHTPRERGLTTTEVAVLTFLLVGGAITVTAIIVAAAQDSANNIPQP